MDWLTLNIRGARGSSKKSWVQALRKENNVSFIALQETQIESPQIADFMGFWGKSRVDFEFVKATGRSGGMVSMWDQTLFSKSRVIKDRYYLIIIGSSPGIHSTIVVVNIYAPHDPATRFAIWNDLSQLKLSIPGMWVFLGDFNEVRIPSDRWNSRFCAINAARFNSFILDANLFEYPMGGRSFTYMSPDGSKLSKIDRVLVCSEFWNTWPHATLLALPRKHSDHCLVILKTWVLDYGPTPFRCFNSWLECPKFKKVVSLAYNNASVYGPPDRRLMIKLKAVKLAIKEWRKSVRDLELAHVEDLEQKVKDLELQVESRLLNEEELRNRLNWMHEIKCFEVAKAKDLQQKARIKWLADGDENSSFFHRSIKCNIKSSRINGLVVNGVWTTSPDEIKKEVFQHFAKRFTETTPDRPRFINNKFKKLPVDIAQSLITPFSKGEIKDAIWECGGDKAPRPDGFNFNFLKMFWSNMEEDFG